MLWYTCYDSDTDEILALGSLQSCARRLGISVSAFYSHVNNAKLGCFCPYTFVIENLKTGKMTTLLGSKSGEMPPTGTRSRKCGCKRGRRRRGRKQTA